MPDPAFRAEVKQAIEIYENTIGRAAARTRRMIEQLGEIEALSRLMVSAELQQGFKVLRDEKQLDKSFEALVIRFQDLFRPDVVEAAQWRLANPYKLF